MPVCENCGEEVDGNPKFCPNCGNEFISSPTGTEESDDYDTKSNKSITLKLVLSWVLGILAIGLGLLFMLISIFGGLLMVIAGVISIPKTRSVIQNKVGINLSQGLMAALFLIGIIAGFTLVLNQTSSTPDYDVEQVKSEAETIPYDELLRNIEDYEGEYVRYEGNVVQVFDRSDDRYVLRVEVTRTGFGWEDDIYVNWEGERILEDDIIILWGVVEGPRTYETVLGNERTIPEITAVDITVR